MIQHHVRTQHDSLVLLDLLFAELRVVETEIHVEVLQVALAGLIADRAVKRVVGEQKFEHGAPAIFGLVALGAYDHSVGDGCVARDLKLGVVHHLDQADTAVSGDRESRVIAVARDVDAEFLCCLDHRGAFGNLDFAAVDAQLCHASAPTVSALRPLLT